MLPNITFAGPLRYRLMASAMFSRSVAEVCAARARRGPLLPGWNFAVELITTTLRSRLQEAFRMEIDDARAFLGSVVISTPELSRVKRADHQEASFCGTWFEPSNPQPDAVLLYLHGGGYAFYPKAAYASYIASVALAANLRTFALDYRLAPEHKYPAQLQDALSAYKYVSGTVSEAKRIVVAGDSAGGNLALTLLLQLREFGAPQPALVLPISPATEFDVIRGSMVENERYDWIDIRILARFASWFCEPCQMSDPLVSPSRGSFKGLAPIYIQAGRREVLFDGIRAFADQARSKGADVTLEAWDDMNHVFQCFGSYAPQSIQALARATEVIRASLDPSRKV
jgi:epsilon-lactone hydrolase